MLYSEFTIALWKNVIKISIKICGIGYNNFKLRPENKQLFGNDFAQTALYTYTMFLVMYTVCHRYVCCSITVWHFTINIMRFRNARSSIIIIIFFLYTGNYILYNRLLFFYWTAKNIKKHPKIIGYLQVYLPKRSRSNTARTNSI